MGGWADGRSRSVGLCEPHRRLAVPAGLAGAAQAGWPDRLRGTGGPFHDDEGPGLIRNYDLDPRLNESTILSTSWCGRRVIGMVDALSGLADGMNEHGLAVSLAFGGRPTVGRGFGSPKIIRYVLEYAKDTPSAVDILRSVPSHMSYNVTLVDRTGAAATVFLSPDRPVIAAATRYAANHQIGVD